MYPLHAGTILLNLCVMKKKKTDESLIKKLISFCICSLVVLAVPNGPVYELVVKGSATPKEEDK